MVLGDVCDCHGYMNEDSIKEGSAPRRHYYLPAEVVVPSVHHNSKMNTDHINKRRKLNATAAATADTPQETQRRTERPISPPPKQKRRFTPSPKVRGHVTRRTRPDPDHQHTPAADVPLIADKSPTSSKESQNRVVQYVQSPVQLTRIKDLAPHQNVDAVGLRDLLGDPLIEECWCFNFLFDIPFIL